VLSPSSAEFTSSLPLAGAANWSSIIATPDGTATAVFPDVDWKSLRSTYGWAGLQFQAWARGEITVCGDRPVTVRLALSGAGEFWVGEQHFLGGDWYAYARAPVVTVLEEGKHEVSVRIAGDIRASGGEMPPTVGFSLVVEEVVEAGLVVGEAMVADVVEGRLIGRWGSLGTRNELKEWVEIVEVRGKNVGPFLKHREMHNDDSDMRQNGTKLDGFEPVRLAPGQSRPIKFQVTDLPLNSTTLVLVVRYRRDGNDEIFDVPFTKELNHVENWYQPQKFT
jgi:hypothetical protein